MVMEYGKMAAIAARADVGIGPYTLILLTSHRYILEVLCQKITIPRISDFLTRPS